MEITITAGELLDKYLWSKFCEITGTNEWAVNEGYIDSSYVFTLTLDQAKALGIFNED